MQLEFKRDIITQAWSSKETPERHTNYMKMAPKLPKLAPRLSKILPKLRRAAPKVSQMAPKY